MNHHDLHKQLCLWRNRSRRRQQCSYMIWYMLILMILVTAIWWNNKVVDCVKSFVPLLLLLFVVVVFVLNMVGFFFRNSNKKCEKIRDRYDVHQYFAIMLWINTLFDVVRYKCHWYSSRIKYKVNDVYGSYYIW